jgi:RNA polymerase sigma factor (sigma-70 family)
MAQSSIFNSQSSLLRALGVSAVNTTIIKQPVQWIELDRFRPFLDNQARMAKFRIDTIADLSRQLTFSPHDARAAQVQAAEELLHLLDPAKAYPLEFVIFKITGYHPKRIHEQNLLTGLALQHDLGLLIERVSDTLDVHVSLITEPVLTIDDVTEKFNVTSKTIQRWRRRGLPARRFIFTDAKRRVGFLLSSVDRFFRAHREQVDQSTANISLVDEAERQAIIRRCRRLAVVGRCSVELITRRVGRKMNRSPLAILHTVRKHDAECPAAEAIFPDAAPEIAIEDRERILRLFRRGTSIDELSRRFDRPHCMIHRALLEERVARLNRKKVRFIDDSLYHGDDAESAVAVIAAPVEFSAAATLADDRRAPRDLPPYLQDLYRTPLLTPAQERALFLRFNYHKFQFVQARRRLDPQFARHRDLQLLELLLRQATESKNAIVKANLRLVVSIARKHLRPALSLMELISDGNITLMRAVEGFDAHRGHRFSTYATLALMKGFARSVPAMLSGARGGAKVTSDAGVLADLPDARHRLPADRLLARDEVRQLLSRLDERERSVLLAHYGLADDLREQRAAATYEQVGQRLGLSKQRVRQIEQSALAKLRAGPQLAAE